VPWSLLQLAAVTCALVTTHKLDLPQERPTLGARSTQGRKRPLDCTTTTSQIEWRQDEAGTEPIERNKQSCRGDKQGERDARPKRHNKVACLRDWAVNRLCVCRRRRRLCLPPAAGRQAGRHQLLGTFLAARFRLILIPLGSPLGSPERSSPAFARSAIGGCERDTAICDGDGPLVVRAHVARFDFFSSLVRDMSALNEL
jgi:hypothetical protein